MTELAPDACIVCGIPKDDEHEWAYLVGADPPGSIACSSDCVAVAIERVKATGRCDAPGVKS